MTDALKNDDVIRLNLSHDALTRLSDYGVGLNIITGKGDIYIPADLVAALAKERSSALTAEITASGKPEIKLILTADGKQIMWDNPLPHAISVPYKPVNDGLSSPESIIVRYTDDFGNRVAFVKVNVIKKKDPWPCELSVFLWAVKQKAA